MSRPDSNHDAALDAQLRAVRLPDGFVERLRQSVLRGCEETGTGSEPARANSEKLASGEVPVPISSQPLSDEELDAVVRAVALPPGLVDRLRQTLPGDEERDSIVGQSPAGPLRLPEQLRRRAKKRLVAKRASQWAAAISLLAALGLGYVGIMSGLLFPTRSADRPPDRVARAGPPAEQPGHDVSEQLIFGDPLPPARAQFPAADVTEVPAPPAPMIRFAAEAPAQQSWLDELAERFGPRSPDPFSDALGRHWGGVFASHRPFDELPELKKAAGLNPRGIAWPLVAGANSAFLIRYGVHPFVSPAAHPQLRATAIPLGVDASSYELTKRWLEDRELPPPDVLRTEEFLAAVDYEFPRPTQQPLGLSVAGGPSPLGAPNVQLLQIGVQAAAFRDADRAAGRLVLVVDVSASMRWGGRLDMVRQALRRLIRQMGPRDRVSLVAFSEGAEAVIEDAGVDDASQFLAAVRALRIRGSTNVGAGLCQAYAVAQQVAVEHAPVRVVLLTDGLAELDRPTAERIEQQLTGAVAQRMFLDVVDLGQEKGPDPQLASFARAGGGAIRRAGNADQVRWALLETLTGRPQLAAGSVALKVSFHPSAVVAYRLFGHEAKAVEGALPDRSQPDFHADQSATALYELQLKPDGGNEVAEVELTWQPPEGGVRQSIARQITRNEFSAAFSSSPLPLQEAAVVAGAAEVLRESPFTRISPYGASLGRVLELAGQVDSRLHQRPSFTDFLAMIEQAMRAKPYRGVGRRW